MDVVKFIEERNRMCESFGDKCTGCPAFINGGCEVATISKLDAKEQVAIVEKWSIEHPKKQKKTRKDVFLEQWPGAEVDKSGCLMLCPMTVSAERRSRHGECTTLVCSDCRREFWMEEVKEDK